MRTITSIAGRLRSSEPCTAVGRDSEIHCHPCVEEVSKRWWVVDWTYGNHLHNCFNATGQHFLGEASIVQVQKRHSEKVSKRCWFCSRKIVTNYRQHKLPRAKMFFGRWRKCSKNVCASSRHRVPNEWWCWNESLKEYSLGNPKCKVERPVVNKPGM